MELDQYMAHPEIWIFGNWIWINKKIFFNPIFRVSIFQKEFSISIQYSENWKISRFQGGPSNSIVPITYQEFQLF